jgi:predicted DNA-binding WGR domain protein
MSFIRKVFGAGANEEPVPSVEEAAPIAGVGDVEHGERAYLEFVGGSSAKFYAVVLWPSDGAEWSVTFNFGRIGTPRSWDHKVQGVDHSTAKRAFDDLIGEKVRKGYERHLWPDSVDLPEGANGVQVGGGGESATPRTPTIFLSQRAGSLPDVTGGELAGVNLPPGRLFHPEANGGSRGQGNVLWISLAPIPEVSRTWSRLADAFSDTGVWPLIMEGDRGLDPFDEILIDVPRDRKLADLASILRHWWSESMGDEDEFDPESAAPFGRAFPGVAPRTPGGRVTTIDGLVEGMQGHLGLVAASRPADVLGLIGWSGAVNYGVDPFEQSLVLQSWEDRFDAYLVGLGFDTIELAVARPPRLPAAATAVSAEHFAFCSDNIWQGVGSIEAYAEVLAGCDRWTFWWD